MSDLITLPEIEEARANQHPHIRRTPLVPLSRDSAEVGGEELFLKLENLQVTGAYKPRGALHVLQNLTPEERARGLVVSSSGNFAQGFAYGGRTMGVRIVVVMMKRANRFKVRAVQGHGAEVVFCENDPETRRARVREVAEERGMVPLNSTTDRRVPIGHSSVGMEILDDMPDVETVVCPVSSGGFIAGVSSAVKLRNPHVRVVGVQPVGAAATYHSLRAGEPVTIDHWESMCDGLSNTRPGEFAFAHVQERVDDVVLVKEEEIAEAIRVLLYRGKILAEPAGAVTAAAWLSGKIPGSGKTAAIISGGNITADLLQTILSGKMPAPVSA